WSLRQSDSKDGSESCFGLRLHLFPPISACRLAPKVFRIGFSEQRINCRARAAHAGKSFLYSQLAAASLSVMTVQAAPRLCDRRVAEQRGVLPSYAHTRAAAT